jgi:hypothetical protein
MYATVREISRIMVIPHISEAVGSVPLPVG